MKSCFFTKQIYPRSLGSWCVKGTEKSLHRVDSLVSLTHHDPRDLGLICLERKLKNRFQIILRINLGFYQKNTPKGTSSQIYHNCTSKQVSLILEKIICILDTNC